MRVISKRPFNDVKKKFPSDAKALESTYQTLSKGVFKTPEELKAVFGSLDNYKHKEKWYVIDIGGNNLRLLAAIQFVHQRMYIKHIVTHAEYDKITEKDARG